MSQPKPIRPMYPDEVQTALNERDAEIKRLTTKLHRVRGFVTSMKAAYVPRTGNPATLRTEICDSVLDIINNAGEKTT